MVKNGGNTAPVGSSEEKLIVKWETCGKTKHRDGTGGVYRGSEISSKDPMDRIKDFIAGTSKKAPNDVQQSDEFCGIFIFEFDEKGRVLKHIIEHTEEGGHWDHLPRVVSVTDWLLSHLNGKGKQSVPELAICEERSSALTSWIQVPVLAYFLQ
ncbi:Mitochondrial protein up-regulated during meiosis [Acrodontium crateriforme]|uniref:Mitochondrial protein up-regulated during meiosis n=1 Tax=Acrodontium crateriforme TaxID=150365 RepID=A0AAQ3M6M5_9PEZI|nr:Mitochondrial protein up-regulated during meiosis [Acrodontium crateriforme]